MPSYSQTNLGVSHRFELPGLGAIKVRFDVINLFDEIYLLRSSTALGAFFPGLRAPPHQRVLKASRE